MRTVMLSQIDEFLRQRRVAIVGISRNPKDYTRNLFTTLKARNYEVIPINPNADEIEGETCYKSISDVKPGPDAVMIFTVKASLEKLVDECIEADIEHIWIHNLTKDKEQKERIYEMGKKNGRNIIIDFCPIMFLPESGFVHKFHGFCLQITGKYPLRKKEMVQ